MTEDLKALAERFSVLDPPAGADYNPRYNIAPTQMVITVGDDGQRYMRQMRWGLIPGWAKDPAIGNRMINARAETLAEKPSFRTALRKRRCIIPADGFYEWQQLGKVKQPVRIVLQSREPFGLAGLWDRWKSPAGEEILSCTIITTAANDLLSQVHDRMPVILTRESESQWLNPKIDDPQQLLPLLKPLPTDTGVELRLRVVAQPEKELEQLLAHLGLELPHRPKQVANVVPKNGQKSSQVPANQARRFPD